MPNTIKFMYYLYDYESGELLNEFTNKKEYYKEWNRREKAGQVCYGGDTNSLLHNMAVELYRGED